MIDRYLLRYFLAVIDEGNFSRAAARCNVSQPTLSAGIAKLERVLAQPLFHRSNRRVELTAAGARLAGHARTIEAEFTRAEATLTGVSTSVVLRLGVLSSIPDAWTAAIVSALPDVRLELVDGRHRELIDHLRRGRIDAALTLVLRESDRFAAEPLLTEGYALAMPARHPLARRPVIEAAALGDSTMIVRRHCELLGETSRHFTARGVRPFFAARTQSDATCLSLVQAGLGVTVMPAGFTAPGVTRPRLADFDHSRTIGLLRGADGDGALAGPLEVVAGTIAGFAPAGVNP